MMACIGISKTANDVTLYRLPNNMTTFSSCLINKVNLDY